MGICSSLKSSSVATVKLILDNGKLLEFSYPVKVSYVLQYSPACFICNSDDMDMEAVVPSVADGEELHPGEIYFALPLTRLNRRIKAEEMAALAVKASSALRDRIVVFSGGDGSKKSMKAAGGGNVGESGRLPRSRGKFTTARLDGITE